MAMTTSRAMELQMSKKWKDRDTSPDRTKVWTEPTHNKPKTQRKVPVVYYLSRSGQLEHPHFMEVPLSSDEGLYLRDVINRLNFLRGKGMASMYSWSSKRSYKNGFVWHDLAENDFIYPAHGQEYVLKGSELLDAAYIPQSEETAFSSSKKPPPAPPIRQSVEDEFPVVTRRRNQSWSAADFSEYKVYKAESSSKYTQKAAADASTQTDDKRRRRRAIRIVEEEEEEEDREVKSKESHDTEKNHYQTTEISTEEISPPPSDSSPETLEKLMKADGRVIMRSETVNEDATDPPNHHLTGRGKASSVLMQLISCGSISFKDCGAGYGKDNAFSLVPYYNKGRLPRSEGSNHVGERDRETTVEYPRVKLEDKEYFSGSLIETKKDEFPALKRSSSYNADRSSGLEVREIKEIDGASAMCIPRKPKSQSTRKEASEDLSCSSSVSTGASS